MAKIVVNYGEGEEDEVGLKEKNRKAGLKRKLSGLIPILALLSFFILGFCFNKWHPGWVVFLMIPFFEMLINLFDKHGKALWINLAILFSVISYIFIGIAFSAWHPGWLVFFLIPIVSIIAD